MILASILASVLIKEIGLYDSQLCCGLSGFGKSVIKAFLSDGQNSSNISNRRQINLSLKALYISMGRLSGPAVFPFYL